MGILFKMAQPMIPGGLLHTMLSLIHISEPTRP